MDALPIAWNIVHCVEVIFIDKMTYLFRFKHSLDLLNVRSSVDFLKNFKYGIRFIVFLRTEAVKPNVAPCLVSKVGVPTQLMIIEGVSQSQRMSYLKARVTLEINKPLRHSISIQGKNGHEWVAIVKYDVIGHEQNRCKKCSEADQAHIISYGCEPLTRLMNLI
ncbi:hypothetical protein NE237_010287 [Protea cynaroides]|uniref:Uncharacterized protein n=1 Tax=Protea cynaroides TaxID=273540 RepID=A0A9Q0KZ09_9MAGN|nr:hypothetical protein NE237_010287 [Protea cynaroides]